MRQSAGLLEVARIELPAHPANGGFDHAAVDTRTSRLYVAHTSNNSVDIVDLESNRFLSSIPKLSGVAGVWVAEDSRLLFTSNRGENTVSIIDLVGGREVFRLPTGRRPNGLAFDSKRHLLLVAGVGDPRAPDAPPTLTFIDAVSGSQTNRINVPGRTRWAVFHPATDSFYVNIAEPASIAVVAADQPERVQRLIPITATGPHGLEQDPRGGRLYCACDDGSLLAVEVPSGKSEKIGTLSGPPDVLWINREKHRLYCAVGDPGAIDVFSLDPWTYRETVATAAGSHTLTVDPARNNVLAFLPDSHEALVLHDG